MARDPTSASTIEQRARRRVGLKTGFLVHALIFVLINGGLFVLALFAGWGDGWGHRRILALPLWGWGLGLAIHGLVVFIRLRGEGLRQRWVEREIEAIRRREGGGDT